MIKSTILLALGLAPVSALAGQPLIDIANSPHAKMQNVGLTAHPRAEQLRNQVALMYGPLLYCLETKDLPEGKDMNNVRIPADIDLKAESAPDLPFGIQALNGTACYLDEKPWGGELYRPLGSAVMTEVPLRMIPYFAWANRGPDGMTGMAPIGCEIDFKTKGSE